METGTPPSTFSNPRAVAGMVLLCIGLVVALCVLIVLFRGTWYLPSLVVVVTVGTVVAYLWWLDGQDFSRGRRAAARPATFTPAAGPGRETTGNGSNAIPQSFTLLPGKEPLVVETGPLYATFTHPKAITSMLLIGIGLGLALSFLINEFRGQWYMPVAFAIFALVTIFLYMFWLDRQDFGD